MERRSTTHRTSARIRIVGFMLGMAVAATVVGASRIPAGAGVLGADVAIVVAPTGELAVKHPGRVLAGTTLTPASDPATGQFTILDQTMFPLNVRVRGVPDMPGPRRHALGGADGPRRPTAVPRIARRLPRLEPRTRSSWNPVSGARSDCARGSPVTWVRATRAGWSRSTWGSA